MACRLPLITSDFGPLPEINVDGETGLVVPAGDVHALAKAIGCLINNPNDCMRYGDVGRKRAEGCFSLTGMVERMLVIYESLVRRRGEKPTRDGNP
jgi:glycosyltransferase involved in cell wall biosynthesis